jgi:Flp pilus assembly protein TadG
MTFLRFDLLRRQRPARLLFRFLANHRGTSSIELAFILPPALLMLGLAVMAGEGFEIERRTLLAARTVTDLVSQTPYWQNLNVAGATQLNQSDLDTDLGLSSEIMWPNSTTGLQVVVSELLVNSANNTGVVVWSRPYPVGVATALAPNTVVPLSPSIVATGATYLIYGQVQYTYQPLNIMISSSPITFNESDILIPRNASQITINPNQ